LRKFNQKNEGGIPEGVYEFHHIHPRKLGGAVRDKNNIVRLSLFEHCQAHILLAKAMPCNETLVPVFRMSGGQYKKLSDFEKITLEEIGEWTKIRALAREIVADSNRERILDEEYVKRWRASKLDHICITKDGKDKCIRKVKLEEFLAKGWIKGRAYQVPVEVKERIAHSKRGRVWINNGNKDRLVSPNDVESYLKEGWQRGRTPAQRERLKQLNQQKARDPEFRRKLSMGCKQAHEMNPEYNMKISKALKGREWTKEHLEKIRSNNQRKAQDPEFRQKISATLSGNICITKDKVNKHIRPEHLLEYLKDGWKKGMYKKSKDSH
jgi:hypothetical protein